MTGEEMREVANPILSNIAARLREMASSYEGNRSDDFGKGVTAGFREAAAYIETEMSSSKNEGWRGEVLDALVNAALAENERAVAQALRGERDLHTGAQWETCFRFVFQRVLNSMRVGHEDG